MERQGLAVTGFGSTHRVALAAPMRMAGARLRLVDAHSGAVFDGTYRHAYGPIRHATDELDLFLRDRRCHCRGLARTFDPQRSSGMHGGPIRLRRRVNGYDMAYIELGEGPPLVCVHGTLGDFRVWSPVLGPLSRRRRVVALSLRHFFPEHWDGAGSDFTIAQHVADVIGFIESLDGRPADLLGHSRGGHIAFRVAQQRPDLLRKLVLADPNGHLDASLSPDASPSDPSGTPRKTYTPIAERVSIGDIDRALMMFSEVGVGPDSWRKIPATVRQTWRDNAHTLLGQVNEQRPPFSRKDAESIRVPTLFVSGTETPDNASKVLQALSAYVAAARVEMITGVGHFMFEDDPLHFCTVVMRFLEE